MNHARFPVVGLAVAFVLLVVFFLRSCCDEEDVALSQMDESNSVVTLSHAKVETENRSDEFVTLFKTPIEIHGRVVDQYGDPVAGANVVLTPVDSPFKERSGSKLELTTDAKGHFSATGLEGASLGVSASKEGYLRRPPLGGLSSSAMVDYAGDASAGKRFSDPETPLVLELHKIGEVGPMVYVKGKLWNLAHDGTSRRIALDSEDGKGPHWIEFRLWSDTQIRRLPGNNAYTQFDWVFEARIPGGGFLWNDSDFNFEAPEVGYKEAIRYERPASLPSDGWQRFENGRYFVKFPDGTYGRIEIDVDAGSDRGPLKMKSWLSLSPGSRNLASQHQDGSGFHGVDPEKE